MATERTELTASRREGTGKGVARKLRAQGLIPAVCYGSKSEPMHLSLPPDAIVTLFNNPKGKNVVFNLSVDGQPVENVMVKDYVVDPVRRNLLHVDFQVVDLDRKIRVRVPINPVGRAAGTRIGGVLSIIRPDIDIQARPLDIPPQVDIDVTELTAGQTILASNVSMPERVEPAFRSDYGLIRVVMPRKKTDK